jgi:hypothetical protein
VQRLRRRLELSDEREKMMREHLRTGVILTSDEAREILRLLEEANAT